MYRDEQMRFVPTCAPAVKAMMSYWASAPGMLPVLATIQVIYIYGFNLILMIKCVAYRVIRAIRNTVLRLNSGFGVRSLRVPRYCVPSHWHLPKKSQLSSSLQSSPSSISQRVTSLGMSLAGSAYTCLKVHRFVHGILCCICHSAHPQR